MSDDQAPDEPTLPDRTPGRGTSLPAPGGPHDPKAPGRLEPVADAPPAPVDERAGSDDAGPDGADDVGPGPEGEDPMQGEAPSS